MPYKSHEKILEYQKQYRAVHKESLRKKAALRYARNRKKLACKAILYREKHKEEIAIKCAKYREEHREEARQRTLAWRRENPGYRLSPEANSAKHAKRRTRKTEAGGSFTAREWKDLCKAYDYRCLCCNRRRKLTADHVIPVLNGGTSNIDNIQPLCGPCNSRKGIKETDYRK